MLQMALDTHPEIVCRGELFNTSGGKRRYKDVAAKLREVYSSRSKAVGWRLLASQPGNEDHTLVRTELRKIPALKVIYLERRNLLAQFVSFKIAEITGNWLSDKPSLNPTIQTTVEEFDAFCTKIIQMHQNNHRDFTDKPSLTIFYEDPFRDNIATVLKFLDLKSLELIPQTIQQESRPLSDVIRFT